MVVEAFTREDTALSIGNRYKGLRAPMMSGFEPPKPNFHSGAVAPMRGEAGTIGW